MRGAREKVQEGVRASKSCPVEDCRCDMQPLSIEEASAVLLCADNKIIPWVDGFAGRKHHRVLDGDQSGDISQLELEAAFETGIPVGVWRSEWLSLVQPHS